MTLSTRFWLRRSSRTGSPLTFGIINGLDSTLNGGDATAQVRLTTAGQFGQVDFYNVWAKLAQRFRSNASFLMSVDCNNAIRQFGTSVGHAGCTCVRMSTPALLCGTEGFRGNLARNVGDVDT